jgi:spoIIIJ-associated protein
MSAAQEPREILELMLGHLGFLFEITEEQRPEGVTLHIRTPQPFRLIGRDGHTLEELQFLFNRILAAGSENAPHVVLDVENYRAQQRTALLDRIRGIVEKVRQSGEPIDLPPMNSFERRMIHLAFKDDPEIETSSPAEPARLKKITIRRRAGRA